MTKFKIHIELELDAIDADEAATKAYQSLASGVFTGSAKLSIFEPQQFVRLETGALDFGVRGETVFARDLSAGDEISSWGVEQFAGAVCKVTMRLQNSLGTMLTLRPVSTNERFTIVVRDTTVCTRVFHKNAPIGES
jgi:hypothetical protein